MGGNRGHEHYTKKAKKEGYLARSAYKLMEIDEKYNLFDQAATVLDIGCAPGSWLQYTSQKLIKKHDAQIIGFDLKPVQINLPQTTTFVQDISQRDEVANILEEQETKKIDVIISDMAPDTIGMSDIDAIRSIGLIEKTLWIYEKFLTQGGKFAIKVFMGPGYDEFVRELKNEYGNSNIVTFKPKSCRPKSKEIYVVKRS